MGAVLTKVRRGAARIGGTARDDGVGRAALLALRLVGQILWWLPARGLDVLLDLRLGGRTRGVVRNESVLRAISTGGDSNWYEPVQTSKFRRILAAVELEPSASAFLDLGAGRGRAVLLAAQAGFADVVGVELDPDLAAAAERNAARWSARRAGRMRGRSLTVLHQDAVDAVIPDGPVLVFLYNSFGPASLRRVLERMVASHRSAPRPIWLCYLNPQHASVVDENPALVVRLRQPDWVLYTVGDVVVGAA